MYFFIFNDEIVGITDRFVVEPPAGFTVVEGPEETNIANLYFDGTIKRKPIQPSELHYWDVIQKAWVLPIILNPVESPDWDKLLTLLQNSPEWGRAYTASERTLKANTAFTTLLTTLTALRNTDTLEFAIAKLREAMSAISGLGDFSSEEIASINQKLTECGFDFQLNA